MVSDEQLRFLQRRGAELLFSPHGGDPDGEGKVLARAWWPDHDHDKGSCMLEGRGASAELAIEALMARWREMEGRLRHLLESGADVDRLFREESDRESDARERAIELFALARVIEFRRGVLDAE